MRLGSCFFEVDFIVRKSAIIDLLLSQGADLNAKNNDGQTPLTIQEPDDDAIVALLKERGAGID